MNGEITSIKIGDRKFNCNDNEKLNLNFKFNFKNEFNLNGEKFEIQVIDEHGNLINLKCEIIENWSEK